MSAKAARRARKKERRARGGDEAFWALRQEYIKTRVVCEKCGLDQPYITGQHDITPCKGPLGIGCGGLTCRLLDEYEIPDIV